MEKILLKRDKFFPQCGKLVLAISWGGFLRGGAGGGDGDAMPWRREEGASGAEEQNDDVENHVAENSETDGKGIAFCEM